PPNPAPLPPPLRGPVPGGTEPLPRRGPEPGVRGTEPLGPLPLPPPKPPPAGMFTPCWLRQSRNACRAWALAPLPPRPVVVPGAAVVGGVVAAAPVDVFDDPPPHATRSAPAPISAERDRAARTRAEGAARTGTSRVVVRS